MHLGFERNTAETHQTFCNTGDISPEVDTRRIILRWWIIIIFPRQMPKCMWLIFGLIYTKMYVHEIIFHKNILLQLIFKEYAYIAVNCMNCYIKFYFNSRIMIHWDITYETIAYHTGWPQKSGTIYNFEAM